MRSHDVTGRTQQAGCDCHMHVSARAGRARERQGVPGSTGGTCVFKTGFEGNSLSRIGHAAAAAAAINRCRHLSKVSRIIPPI